MLNQQQQQVVACRVQQLWSWVALSGWLAAGWGLCLYSLCVCVLYVSAACNLLVAACPTAASSGLCTMFSFRVARTSGLASGAHALWSCLAGIAFLLLLECVSLRWTAQSARESLHLESGSAHLALSSNVWMCALWCCWAPCDCGSAWPVLAIGRCVRFV